MRQDGRRTRPTGPHSYMKDSMYDTHVLLEILLVIPNYEQTQKTVSRKTSLRKDANQSALSRDCGSASQQLAVATSSAACSPMTRPSPLFRSPPLELAIVQSAHRAPTATGNSSPDID
ncbi:hypothetical protein JG688_00015520 [Phytophthora aleatoria]|uniref:Uncharacterized protein n=1 Tax=Phytophthora aleatoria TaxID=2496075 RepID=A0A8J5I5R2_9STRA|nr:hypothetical protein JG688_00015520 [Phytophthora aleatoria]